MRASFSGWKSQIYLEESHPWKTIGSVTSWPAQVYLSGNETRKPTDPHDKDLKLKRAVLCVTGDSQSDSLLLHHRVDMCFINFKFCWSSCKILKLLHFWFFSKTFKQPRVSHSDFMFSQRYFQTFSLSHQWHQCDVSRTVSGSALSAGPSLPFSPQLWFWARVHKES